MLDEVIITETPPLYCCYGKRGQQVCAPITGNRAKRVLHGVINIVTGELLLLITEVWDEATHQCFLGMIRSHWRGWRIILFEDRGTPHTADGSQDLAEQLGLQIRWLPRATPELNAMDHLFRSVKGRALANRATCSIDDSAMAACRYLYKLNRQERLRKAGILSGNFCMKNNDDIPTTDTNEIKQLINRVKQGELDQGDAQLIEKLLNFLVTIVSLLQQKHTVKRRRANRQDAKIAKRILKCWLLILSFSLAAFSLSFAWRSRRLGG